MAHSIVTGPTESIPLKVSNEVVYISNTRVTLDSVVDAFSEGATPEEIAYQYPSLELADVYAVVGYYLHHRTELDNLLEHQRQRALSVRQQNESRFPPTGIRARLLARRPQ